MSFPFSDLGPELVATFATHKPVTRVRRGASTVAHGFTTEAAPSRAAIEAVIYPASYRDMQVLPEGKRTEESLHVISTAELRTALEGQYPADRLEYQGRVYEVAQVKDWNANAGFWSVIAVRIAAENG